jgi:non-specific serine/threonine protein kinase
MQFLNPGMLGSYKYFQTHYIRPIEKLDDELKKEDLRQLVQPYLLRRTKEMVATDLPPLTETIFYSEMAEAQRKLYEHEKSAARNQLLNLGDPNLPQNRVVVLAALTRLRQLANHPALVFPDEKTTGGKFEDVLVFWNTIRRSGHKVLIFSFFEKYLQLFRAEFEKEGQPYAWLTGDVSQKNRQEQVELFSQDASIQAFLMTTTAGGVGLNLTAADYVFVLDPWWNPFRESQAIARAHRIGQTKNVMAVKFIARETIEEKILQLQQRKANLAGEFLDLGEKMVQTREDLAFLLG